METNHYIHLKYYTLYQKNRYSVYTRLIDYFQLLTLVAYAC